MRRLFARLQAGLVGGDPTMFMAGFALWSLLTGLSIVLSRDVFDKAPIYASLLQLDRRLGIGEDLWGALMLLDALAISASLFRRGPTWPAALAAVTGAFWLFIGIEVTTGAAMHGFFSAVGPWEIAASLGCFAATLHNDGRG